MTPRFIVRPAAEADIAEAALWYESRSIGLGAEFLRAVDACFEEIRRTPEFRPTVVNPSRCFFVELPGGHVVNRATGQPLDFDDPCFSEGATAGYDPVAHRQAIRAVKEFLRATFKL